MDWSHASDANGSPLALYSNVMSGSIVFAEELAIQARLGSFCPPYQPSVNFTGSENECITLV
jgi:hypothetical protein